MSCSAEKRLIAAAGVTEATLTASTAAAIRRREKVGIMTLTPRNPTTQWQVSKPGANATLNRKSMPARERSGAYIACRKRAGPSAL
jgi:hypothetical protein